MHFYQKEKQVWKVNECSQTSPNDLQNHLLYMQYYSTNHDKAGHRYL